MRLSKRTEYGLQALVHLARGGTDQRFVQSRDLAEAEALPGKYVELVLMSLRRAGLLQSRAGVGGGYRLARAPAHIRVADVIDALERAGDDEEERSTREASPGRMAVGIVLSRFQDVVGQVLGDMTLEKLLEQLPRNPGQATGMYYI